MGAEARCVAYVDGAAVEGKALLETSELLFRGEGVRLAIPFSDMTAVEAVDGHLRIAYAGGEAALDLGDTAAKWARKILNPPSLMDKLGVKPGMRVSMVGRIEGDLARQVRERGALLSENGSAEADLVFLAVDTREDLAQLDRLRRRLAPKGAIWIIRPKGSKQISEAEAMAAGKAAGLVDVKVARYSDTHTAEKFVIPVSSR
ncbi:MAG TPA: hypothetical protein VNL92_01875 [Dehalococcoidia bacterium]|nr:hypothetical protein [Dehalococcoidia bacterium]